MEKKNSNIFFGFFLGGLSIAAFLGLAYFSFRVSNQLIDYLDIGHKRPAADYSFLKEDFRLCFENDRDLKVFDPREAAFIRSGSHAIEGKYSMRAEFPSGRQFPAIGLEVYGKDCYDWSNMEEFSFSVFNAIDAPARLTVHLKSGAAYPKKSFETTQEVPPLSLAMFRIDRSELENALDLGHISAINFVMNDPTTTFIMYFDDIKVARRSN